MSLWLWSTNNWRDVESLESPGGTSYYRQLKMTHTQIQYLRKSKKNALERQVVDKQTWTKLVLTLISDGYLRAVKWLHQRKIAQVLTTVHSQLECGL